jgi:HSP20 family molecular chaperone IbpA
MNVWTNEESAVVTAELPGVILDDIDITVEDDMLTLRGHRQPDEGVDCHSAGVAKAPARKRIAVKAQ